MKKVLVLSNMYPSTKFPHYGIFVKNTNKILKSCGCKVHTVAVTKTNIKIFKLLKYFIFFVRAFFALNFRKFDIVYVHYPAFSGIPLRFWYRNKTQLVVNIHGNDLVPEEEKDKFFLKNTDIAVKQADYIVLPSEYFKEKFFERYPDYDSKKVYVFPSGGVNRKVFYRDDRVCALKNMHLNPNYKYISFVSRIEANKGWDLFVKIINQLKNKYPNYRYIIVGSGSQEEVLRKMIKKYGLEHLIYKYSYLKHEKLNEVFNSSDIFCFPSLRESESLGLVGLEAMACGCIVISTSGTGPASYIKNNYNGFIAESNTSTSMAKKINEIISMSNEDKNKIRVNAETSTVSYSLSNTATRFKAFINSI